MSESPEPYPTAAFHYELPPTLIARYPAAERDASRLLVVDRNRQCTTHHTFRQLPSFISPGDVLVLNETRVLPARLRGRRAGGGAAEVLLLHPERDAAPDQAAGGAPSDAVPGPADWRAMVRPGSRLGVGRMVVVADDLRVEMLRAHGDGTRTVRLHSSLAVREALERYGLVPLPPYIERAAEAADRERYQTVYGRTEGSVAAPTAGLHFTPALLDDLTAQGVRLVRLTLHVGAGTFRPVEVDDPAQHVMHAEQYDVSAVAAAEINDARLAGARVWAVGTTVARTLETCADAEGRVRPGRGWTSLFIRPGYRFRAIDRLLTNFHLPRSTLLMLVTAFGGYDLIMRAYAEAVAERYRFYSYGDAMAVL